MELAKYEPSTLMRSLQSEIDTLFNRFFERPWGVMRAPMEPSLDVAETDTEFIVKADLPGLEEKDFEVNVLGDMLTIRGEKKKEREEKGKTYYLFERTCGSFSRSVRLPTLVNSDQVKATYKKGVLEIELPKKEAVRAKKVLVKAEE